MSAVPSFRREAARPLPGAGPRRVRGTRHVRALLVALLLPCAALLPACASNAHLRPTPEVPGAARCDPLAPLVRWREAERRRDFELALEVLHVAGARERERLRAHLDELRRLPPGPVRAPIEFHLVDGPAPCGEELYFALEPAGSGHALVRYRLVPGPEGPRLVPELPPQGAEGVAPSLAARRHGEHALWISARGPELERAVERLRWSLRAQVRALELARRENLSLIPFEPPPQDLLARLEGRSAPEVRAQMLAWLQE